MDSVAHVVVDIASLAARISDELTAAEAAAGQLVRGCPIVITEVDKLTRSIDPEEYVPQHISIGPYHRTNNPHLAMDNEKFRCLGAVLSSAFPRVTLEVYLKELASLEPRAKRCYANSFEHMDGAEFVRMLLLDACYVLVRFAGVLEAAARRGNGGGARVEAPPLAGGDMMGAVAVVRDVLYLAENQIPFFVLDKVYNLTIPDFGVSAADAITGYVRELLGSPGGPQYSVATPGVAEPDEIGNLLHLLHMHFTPTSPSSPATGSEVTGGRRRVGRWRTATEYHSAGVRFRTRPLVGKAGARSILDVKLLGSGTLEIPRLNIDAETWRLLRNLVALEQSNPGAAGSHVTAYCVFVSQLACTPRDVELLSRRGVISHGLGSDGEVAKLFADLCKGVAFRADDPRSNYLHATWQAMEGRFRCRPRRWAAWLMLRYFSNPWLAVGLAAAAVGLVCTVVQAVYSVLSYTSGGGS